MSRNVIVIGVGNASRGDDAAGLEVVRRLAELSGEAGIDVLAHARDCTALLDLWNHADAAVLVDAMRSSATPGTIRRTDASSVSIGGRGQWTSSHAVGLADAIELGRSLGRLPPVVVVYGIEGATFDNRVGLSDAVSAAIAPAAEAVRREARSLSRSAAQ